MERAEQRALEQFPEESPVRSANITDEDRLRWAFIQGYQRAEKDIFDDLFTKGNVVPKADVVDYAFELYDNYVNMLVESLSNIAKNFRGMSEMAETSPNRLYFRAKAEAFEEFVERIQKENDLIKQEYNYGDREEIYRKFKMKKNFDVDYMIDENKYRGTRKFDKLMKFKGKLADLLEHYSYKAFECGVLYNELSKKEPPQKIAQTIEQMLREIHILEEDKVDEDVIDDGYGHGIGC
jgi:hypothetical protein